MGQPGGAKLRTARSPATSLAEIRRAFRWAITSLVWRRIEPTGRPTLPLSHARGAHLCPPPRLQPTTFQIPDPTLVGSVDGDQYCIDNNSADATSRTQFDIDERLRPAPDTSPKPHKTIELTYYLMDIARTLVEEELAPLLPHSCDANCPLRRTAQYRIETQTSRFNKLGQQFEI